MTTAIRTETDHAVSNILKDLPFDEAMDVACQVLGKDARSYEHLDHGRTKMTAGNLLRGAARHDPALVKEIRAVAARVSRGTGFRNTAVKHASRASTRRNSSGKSKSKK